MIFEDDYDYDFHYLSKPLLPLIGADPAGWCLYCGSLTKTISPAFRIGLSVGLEDIIAHLASLAAYHRPPGRYDAGECDRRASPDGCYSALSQEVGPDLQATPRPFLRVADERNCGMRCIFRFPMVGWPSGRGLIRTLTLLHLQRTRLKRICISPMEKYPGYPAEFRNYIRLGFASSDQGELEEAVKIIKDLL